jgi:hypothetical protein
MKHMVNAFWGKLNQGEGACSTGHQMASKSIRLLFKAVALQKGDIVLEMGYGNYPRLAIMAAILTGNLVIATECLGNIYCLIVLLYIRFIEHSSLISLILFQLISIT